MSCPRHVAIIMDGNGRWARARALPRYAGHKAGVKALHKIVRHSAHIGLEWLTLYAFSSENWSRPVDEVNSLISLLKLFIKQDLAELHSNNVRIHIIGSRENMPHDIMLLLQKAETMTEDNTGLKLVIAFNYGGRDELVRAVKRIATSIQSGQIEIDQISEKTIAQNLDIVPMPDPDLIIRTSGEQRLSNFLSWQSAYSELYFSPCLWPDFNETAFDLALSCYASRERRFGGLLNSVIKKEAVK
ncbi:isoprenyl transferase [Bartonella tamiae]|uniref:Isoprenyl transferase n=1 Tax=Bartonella tamiae Th239 TaxID=1094558 RepID=J1JVP8_9HYPH|nr:isoprenyl transferase [Bartonella tamiae]EJF88630.1 di-trans,poly-cis-decaprenylcistransferase [Bartonella tamiae Th239]EJF95120.1 di-trans,poly-cis-decaprenylcistransferase [Bartonella tamiae Th307]